MKFTVLGEGAWGTACATLLANNGHNVNLWCYNPEVAHEINSTRVNSLYLPSVKLDHKISAIPNLKDALDNVDWICEAVPTQFLRPVIEKCKKYITNKQSWVILSKGIETGTLLLPSEIINDVLGTSINFVVLSGPSFAMDLAKQQITGVNLASQDLKLAQNLSTLLLNEYFLPIIILDPIGTQICGALKNVYAIVLGIISQLGYSDNTRAFMISIALSEMKVICCALGGSSETVYSLAGIGDLILSSLSNKSRNFMFGQMIAEGKKTSSELLNSFNSTPEGFHNLISIYQIQQKHNLNVQILENLYKIVFEEESPNYIFTNLI